ncbi:MAG: SNF2-related protein [Pirellulales bacterium]
MARNGALAKDKRDLFWYGDRKKGERLYRRGAVLSGEVQGHTYVGTVQGVRGRPYTVKIHLDVNDGDRESLFECDCQRARGGNYCPHQWALMRQFDAESGWKIDPSDVTATIGYADNDDVDFHFEDDDEFDAEDDDVEDDDGDDDGEELRGRYADRNRGGRSTSNGRGRSRAVQRERPEHWRHAMACLNGTVQDAMDWQANDADDDELRPLPPGCRLLLAIDLKQASGYHEFDLICFVSEPLADGGWGTPRRWTLTDYQIARLEDPAQRARWAALRPMLLEPWGGGGFWGRNEQSSFGEQRFNLPVALQDEMLSQFCRDGTLVTGERVGAELHAVRPVIWDDGPPWEVTFCLRPSSSDGRGRSGKNEMVAELRREGESKACPPGARIFDEGLMLAEGRLSSLAGDMELVRAWLNTPRIEIPRREFPEFLRLLAEVGQLPALEIADELNVQRISEPPKPVLELTSSVADRSVLVGLVRARYGRDVVSVMDHGSIVWDTERQALLIRDSAAEQGIWDQLQPFVHSTVWDWNLHEELLAFQVDGLSELVPSLGALGWEILLKGQRIRAASRLQLNVATATDWFDLEGAAEFGDESATLPALIEALRSGRTTVVLADGSHGIVPADWIDRFRRLTSLGDSQGSSLRFGRAQALLLDSLLAGAPHASRDVPFQDLCQKLRAFDGIQPQEAPAGFCGQLRPYQQAALGWFDYLRQFRFGGCLADDMGLGKTVQVLAMLVARRRELADEPSRQPSLVVVPKSLVFNWIEEAARFAPELKVIDHTGVGRSTKQQYLSQFDLVVTTYGTMLRDVTKLSKFEFDYVILDEAQAIKNAGSQTAKAARILRARHRLAMTGTPVENHLGELWSLLEFLNPGMMGNLAARNSKSIQLDAEWLEQVKRGVRPFILRRTKQQVLTELPEKIEQTLYCDMGSRQKKLYQELRDHYRRQIGAKVEQLGIKKAKIHVLEALLRLRQAACDPRLLDARQKESGAKLELLAEQLEEVLAERHKVLVFSQFTSLLALVRKEFDRRGWSYEYLDGATRNRAARVKRFQEDDSCQLFLISLKAGGHGLNLTAADYAYILDPWWNPAVEAQAIDRAHRLGQTRTVNAYRIICRDTVEEKILQLQATKRQLADSIIEANESLISQLSLDDLQLLFS